MARADSMRYASALDWAALSAGTVMGVVALVFRLALWPPVVDLFNRSSTEFVAAFARLAEREQMVLFSLGVVTTILTLVIIAREGAASRRGHFRVAAVAVLLALSVVSTVGMDPLEQAIVTGADGAGPAGVAPLMQQYARWQWLNLALIVLVSTALVAAHRAPVPLASTAPDALTGHHRLLLFLLGAATLFEGYDRFIVSLALPYIGKDLGASEGDLGWALSAIRIGAVLSIVLARFADRYGRRRLLLITIVAYTIATAATGFSQGLLDFVILQLIATVFLVTELTLAHVVIAEEFPPSRRGRGQGSLGAFAALGAGVAALLFPVLQKTALGWRGLYFVGLGPLLLVVYLWRALPETGRWEQARGGQASVGVRFRELVSDRLRVRFTVLLLASFCVMGAGAAAGGFLSYRATNTFGWRPAQVSAMILTGGGVGLLGWFIFGRLADTLGRRFTGVLSFVGAGIMIVVFYSTPYLLPAMAGLVFAESGAAIAINSLGTELFPTRVRASAKAWVTNAGVVGAMGGLATVGALSERTGGAEVVISALALLPVLAAPAFYLLPETRGERLEIISAD